MAAVQLDHAGIRNASDQDRDRALQPRRRAASADEQRWNLEPLKALDARFGRAHRLFAIPGDHLAAGDPELPLGQSAEVRVRRTDAGADEELSNVVLAAIAPGASGDEGREVPGALIGAVHEPPRGRLDRLLDADGIEREAQALPLEVGVIGRVADLTRHSFGVRDQLHRW